MSSTSRISRRDLRQQGVVTILVAAQHGLMGPSMTTPLDVSYLADSVVLFRFFESTGQIHRALSAVKKRSGDHEATIRELVFSTSGITVGEPLHEFHGVLTGVPTFARVARAHCAMSCAARVLMAS